MSAAASSSSSSAAATNSSSNSGDLNEHIASRLLQDCPICFIRYSSDKDNRPRILPCGHSLCESCVRQMIQVNNGKLECPEDRHTSIVHSVEELPINVPLIRQVELVKQYVKEGAMKEEKSDGKSSSSSDGWSAAVAPIDKCSECACVASHHCTDCDADYCETHCQQAHAFAAMKKHRTVPISEKAVVKGNKPPICEKHHSPMLLFCQEQQCKTLCCSICHSHGTHKGHTTVLVEEHVSTVRKELTVATEVNVTALNALDVQAKQLDECEKRVQRERVQARAAILDKCRELREKIEAEQDRLLEELDATANTALKHLHLRMTDVALARSQASFVVETVKRVSEMPMYPLISHSDQPLKEKGVASERVAALSADSSEVIAGVRVNRLSAVTDIETLSAATVVSCKRNIWTWQIPLQRWREEGNRQKMRSDEFTLEGETWRLELYPLGNVRKDSKWANCVSVYLALSTAPPADGIECKYGLRVRNPRGGKDVELVSTQKFTNENMSWGRPSLLTANEVEQYIDANGYCTVEVNVGKVN